VTRRRRWIAAGSLGLAACSVQAEGVPEGKLAVVGAVELGPQDLDGVKPQLGAYAQLRFEGDAGRMALLEALVVAELLAQEAVAGGLRDDPRVEFALAEELAELFVAAELERRVPGSEIAADVAALRAYYDAHPEEFMRPERRSIRGVVRRDLAEAERDLESLRAGDRELEELGDVVRSEVMVRDDAEHPGFHAVLFDPDLRAGDLLPVPVIAGRVLVIGYVDAIEPAGSLPFDDAVVRERLVAAVRAPRLAAARQQLLEELRVRYPDPLAHL
jgi:hypothetical protein